MRLIPQRNQIVARTVDFVRSPFGLVLPDLKNVKTTIFALIEAVGPDVEVYKVGQVVLCQRHSQVILRDGFHRLIFSQDEVLSVVAELELALCSISGADPGAHAVDNGNGRGEVHADGA